MKMRSKTEKSFRDLMDTFSGTDGGVRFVRFRIFVEQVDARASAGDLAADKVIEILHQMHRMLDLASGQAEGKVT